ncbi:MAG TPA: hypothetical protein VF841_07560 [Anaeromyxobacter sp.]
MFTVQVDFVSTGGEMRRPIVAALLLVIACVGPQEFGRPINPADASKLTVGVSTLEDAKAIFGEPGNCITGGGNLVTCTWTHSIYDPWNKQQPAKTEMVLLQFKDGKLMQGH